MGSPIKLSPWAYAPERKGDALESKTRGAERNVRATERNGGATKRNEREMTGNTCATERNARLSERDGRVTAGNARTAQRNGRAAPGKGGSTVRNGRSMERNPRSTEGNGRGIDRNDAAAEREARVTLRRAGWRAGNGRTSARTFCSKRRGGVRFAPGASSASGNRPALLRRPRTLAHEAVAVGAPTDDSVCSGNHS